MGCAFNGTLNIICRAINEVHIILFMLSFNRIIFLNHYLLCHEYIARDRQVFDSNLALLREGPL